MERGCRDRPCTACALVRPVRASFRGLSPASRLTSRIASASSAKRDTKPELLLRRAINSVGLTYKVDVASLPGRPDLVVPAARVAVFCDGDFWHGRNLKKRLEKLQAGHNAAYWVRKLKTNVARDRKVDVLLRRSGWTVLRFWESELRADPNRAAKRILSAARPRRKKP